MIQISPKIFSLKLFTKTRDCMALITTLHSCAPGSQFRGDTTYSENFISWNLQHYFIKTHLPVAAIASRDHHASLNVKSQSLELLSWPRQSTIRNTTIKLHNMTRNLRGNSDPLERPMRRSDLSSQVIQVKCRAEPLGRSSKGFLWKTGPWHRLRVLWS